MLWGSEIALLVLVNALWLVQISLPLLDARVPSLFSVPVSELLSLPLGAMLVLCAHSLYVGSAESGHLQDPVQRTSSGAGASEPRTRKHGVQQSSGRPGGLDGVLFLSLASMWTAGIGMHVSAVVVQMQLTPDDSLYPMVHHHLHRLWSHNIFQSGYFGLLLFLCWTNTRHWKNAVRLERGPRWFVVLLQVLWSVLVGASYTVVAKATETVTVTVSFYIASVLLAFFTSGGGSMGSMPSVATSVTVSSLSGLLVMPFYIIIIVIPPWGYVGNNVYIIMT